MAINTQSGKFPHLSGVKTTRNDGGLRIRPRVSGKKEFLFGCLDIDGYGPQSLWSDATPPPKSADSSYLKIEILSVSETTSLLNGQKFVISHGSESIEIEIAASTVLAEFKASKSTPETLANGIFEIVNANGINIYAQIDDENSNIVWVKQKPGAGRSRITVSRQDLDNETQKIHPSAIKFETGSTDPLEAGFLLEFGEPALVNSFNQASALLKNNPNVGPTNELFAAYSEASEGGANNISICRLDFTYRPDENGKLWPVLASTGTLPVEWLEAMGVVEGEVPVSLLSTDTHYIPSNSLRALPWVGCGDVSSVQAHLDPTPADFRYYAIGQAMDIAQDAQPEIIRLADSPGFINAPAALFHPEVGRYPLSSDMIPTSQSIINSIKSRDLPTADNPELQKVVYDTSAAQPFPFKSFDTVGATSVTIEIVDNVASDIEYHGLLLSSGDITKYFVFTTEVVPTGAVAVSEFGDISIESGRNQTARALANEINADSQLKDLVRATVSGSVITLTQIKHGFLYSPRVLETSIQTLTFTDQPQEDDEVNISSNLPVVGNFDLVAKVAPAGATEFAIGGSVAETVTNIAAALNANMPDYVGRAVLIGTTVIHIVPASVGITFGAAGAWYTPAVVDSTVTNSGTGNTEPLLVNHITAQYTIELDGLDETSGLTVISPDGTETNFTCVGADGPWGEDGYFAYPDDTVGVQNVVKVINESGLPLMAKYLGVGVFTLTSLKPGEANKHGFVPFGPGYSTILSHSISVLSTDGLIAPVYSGSINEAVSRSFAHLAAAFSYNTSIDFMSCRAILGLEPMDKTLRGTITLKELQKYVGRTRTHLTGNYVDGLSDNGTGICGFTGMKILDGTKRTRDNEALPVTYRLWGGTSILNTESWSDVHILADSPAYGDQVMRDGKGELVDLGAYLCVIADEGFYTGAGARSYDRSRGRYLASGAGVYAAILASKLPNSAMTNQTIPSFSLLREKTASMRNALTSLRFTTFKNSGGTVRVEDSPTMAYNIDEYNRSDYVRQLTVDIVGEVHKGVRIVADPFIGRTMSPTTKTGLETQIDSKLNEYVEAEYILSKAFNLIITPEGRILSGADVDLELTVPGELRTLNVRTSLVPESA